MSIASIAELSDRAAAGTESDSHVIIRHITQPGYTLQRSVTRLVLIDSAKLFELVRAELHHSYA